MGQGEGFDLCELENAPETQKCPRTLVHDCRLYRIIVLRENEKLTRTGREQLLRETTHYNTHQDKRALLNLD